MIVGIYCYKFNGGWILVVANVIALINLFSSAVLQNHRGFAFQAC
jgi:low affinity Fe/Cu permease